MSDHKDAKALLQYKPFFNICQEPTVLSRLEQIVYLFTNLDGDQVLLESCNSKKNSVYMKKIGPIKFK